MGLTPATLPGWRPWCRLDTAHGGDAGRIRPVAARHRAASELRELRSIFGPVTELATLRPPRYGLRGHVTSARLLDEMTLFRAISHDSATPEVFAKRIRPGGKGLTAGRAELSALGEAAERLFSKLASWWASPGYRYGPAGRIGGPGEQVLGPESLPLFAEEQYESPAWPFDRFTERSLLGWAKGTRLLSGQLVWVPAQLAYFGYRRLADESWLRLGNTGGIALGPTHDAAVLGALEEVVERDSINLSWYCNVPPRPLDLTIDEVAGQPAGELVRWHRRQLGYDVRLYVHPWSADYAVVSAVRTGGPTAYRRLSVGTAASIDVRAAARRALEELIQQDNVLRGRDVHPDWPTSRKLDTIQARAAEDLTGSTHLYEAVLHYGTVDRLADLAPRFGRPATGPSETCGPGSGPSERPADTGTQEALAALVAALGVDPIVVDMTGCLEASGFHALHLVRVLVPELTLPNLISWPALGHPRYRDLPAALGLAPRPLAFEDLTSAEIPFG